MIVENYSSRGSAAYIEDNLSLKLIFCWVRI